MEQREAEELLMNRTAASILSTGQKFTYGKSVDCKLVTLLQFSALRR